MMIYISFIELRTILFFLLTTYYTWTVFKNVLQILINVLQTKIFKSSYPHKLGYILNRIHRSFYTSLSFIGHFSSF